MPKVIENLEQVILEKAREVLLEQGYASLNIREIAKECKIATGTIYNYYPSKEFLAANVMLVDWNQAINKMIEQGRQEDSIQALLSNMYIELKQFCSIYRPIWRGYQFNSKSPYSFHDRHELLKSQLAVILQDGLKRFTNETNSYMAEYLADNLLTISGYEEFDYSKVEEIWNRLFH